MKKIKAVIIGASGYTGVELIRILINHENVEIVSLVANSNAGQEVEDIYPHLRNEKLPKLVKLDEVDFSGVDVAFCCLPHATSQKIIKGLPELLKVIDLSADFRINDADTYEKWYGHKHAALDLQEAAAYGLTEIFKDEIRHARIVACPGCYPTGASLPLFPLLKEKAIETDDIIIDAKTGITGAGRSVTLPNLFAEANESAKAYKICNHRHMPEIEQTLSLAGCGNVMVNFTPQVVPMSRGILSTIYVKLAKGRKASDLCNILSSSYKDTPFVQILNDGELPSTRDVYGTNNCVIAVVEGRTDDRAVIVSVIDNLTKGSSGQAVQNMNIMFGIDETAGLQFTPVFP